MLYLAASVNFALVVQIVIHRPKNLQQEDPKTNFLSEDFPKILKRSLVFRARVVVGPFSLKLNSITMSFKFNIFLTLTSKTISKDRLVLRNIAGC